MNDDGAIHAQRALYRGPSPTPLGHIKIASFFNKSLHRVFQPMRVLGSYALVYLLEGGGVYSDANHYQRRVSAGDLLLLFPELAHSYGPVQEDVWNEFFIVFEGPAFDLLRRTGLLCSQRPVLRLEPIEEWTPKLAFPCLTGNRPGQDPDREHLLHVCRLLSVLAEAATIRREDVHETRGPSWLNVASSLLGGDLNHPLPPAEVAARVGVSYESFRKRFQQATGVSPARYRNTKRIEAAQALLDHTQMTHEEIAESLGFSDSFHFSKRFKQLTGLTPGAYRKRRQSASPIASSQQPSAPSKETTP